MDERWWGFTDIFIVGTQEFWPLINKKSSKSKRLTCKLKAWYFILDCYAPSSWSETARNDPIWDQRYDSWSCSWTTKKSKAQLKRKKRGRTTKIRSFKAEGKMNEGARTKQKQREGVRCEHNEMGDHYFCESVIVKLVSIITLIHSH